MTKVFTVSFMPAGINIGYEGYGTTVSFSSGFPGANAKNKIMRGLQEWEKHCDVIFLDIPDNGAALGANTHSQWHIRIGAAPAGVGGVWATSIAPPNFATTNITIQRGEDNYILYNSTFGPTHPINDTFDDYYARKVAMHEGGHSVFGLLHNTVSPKDVMENGYVSSLSPNTADKATIVGRHGAAKTISTLYSGDIGLITLLYRGLLNAIPTMYGDGFKYLSNAKNAGATWETIAQSLLNTPEYLGGPLSGVSNATWVLAVHTRVTGTSTGYSSWVTDLDTAAKTKAKVAVEICAQAAAKTKLLADYPNGWWKF